MRHQLTRDQDKAAWVLARLVRSPNRHVTLARFIKLGLAYERLNPLVHDGPTAGVNFHPYGQRLSERALALHCR